MEEERQKR
jgi:hypothetical protein